VDGFGEFNYDVSSSHVREMLPIYNGASSKALSGDGNLSLKEVEFIIIVATNTYSLMLFFLLKCLFLSV
jgi:hypothetical protein